MPTVVFVDRLPDGPAGAYADYLGRRLAAPGWHRVDVRAACHEAQPGFTTALTTWHEALMAVAARTSPWAWLLPGSRIHVRQEPVRPLLFALGLLRALQSKTHSVVHVVGAPPEVGQYVAELRGDGAGASTGRGWRAILRWGFEVLTVIRKKWHAKPSSSDGPVDLLMFSLGLSVAAIRDRGDHYFGQVFDKLAVRTAWVYYLENPKLQGDIRTALAARGRDAAYDHAAATWGDIVWAAVTAAVVAWRMRRVVAQAPAFPWRGAQSRGFATRYAADLLVAVPPVAELVAYRAFVRTLARRRPATVCYPYEEKGFERALLMAVSASGRPVRTLGFAHNAYNSGLLYVNEAHTAEGRPPRPTLLVAGGDGLADWFAGIAHRTDTIVSVGSPRWVAQSTSERRRHAGAPLKVLFLTGFGHELRELAAWLLERPDAFEQVALTIRPNPHAWAAEQAEVFPQIASLPFVRVESDRSLTDQMADADIVLFCNTSAVAEAIWAGRIAVYAEFSDLWVAHPLEGKPYAETVPDCDSPDELAAVLRRFAAMNAQEYAAALDGQRRAAAQVYAPFDPAAFMRVVTDGR